MASTIDIISVGGATNTVVIGEGSVRHYELMSSDYVRLVFSTDKKINIRIGDHITTKEWGTFYITEQQRPTYNKSTGGFDYDLQFKAPYYLWNNRLYKYDPKNKRNEASWSLTDNLENHMAVFLRNLSYYGWTYTVDSASYGLEEAQRTVYISFQNKYLLDALSQIAESFNLEYWITDNIIHFGKVESGTAVDFNLGDNVEEMTAENSESDGITRYYAFGSTQNIPSGYRKSDSTVLLNGVVQKRLMLPEGTPYIDIESGLKDDEIVEGIVTFDDVYPRTKSSVSEVIKVPKTVEKSNTVEATTEASAKASDSDSKTEVVNIYRFKTTDFNFSADYILANTDLQVQFVSGKLNGMTFDVAFNPNGASETTVVDGKTVANPDAQLFELVRNDTYGLMLPNDTLCPAAGDKFILLGWDANKLTAWQELITKAEEELKSQLETYVKKKQIDPLTYVCTMMSDYMYGLDANGNQDPNYSKVGSFPIGQKVRLYSDVYFKEGSRESRVIGYEYKLDIPYDAAQIYVGESPIYSTSKATQNAINEATSSVINYRGNNYTNDGTGGGNLFLIRSTDTVTAPSDTNVYSSKRSDLDFAHKRKDDRISALWTFSHGKGARRGVQSQDYDNNAVNEDNLFGHGFELVEKTNSQGNTVSRLEIDELLVRTKAFFAELEVRKIAYVGGNYLFSSAGSKVYHVEWLLSDGSVLDKATHTADEAYTFRCYMYSDDGTTATMNGFAADDQVMCRTFNIDSGVHTNVSNKYWWRRCVGVGKGKIAGSDDDKEYQYVDISKADCLENSDYPEAEDVIVQFGNWTDKARQGAIFLMVYGDLAPAILEWENVGAGGKHFVLPDPTIQISPKGNIFYGEFHSVAEKTGGNSGSIDDQINALIEQLNDIKNQADKKFEIWFGSGVPHPDSSTDTESNAPASDWTTEAEKALHAQDLYYDTDKSPASKGGRAWRWMAHNASSAVVYYWEEVTDKDTIDALEKAADLQNQVDDIVSDGIISHGSEKSSLLVEWNTACSNYNKYNEQVIDYSLQDEDVWKNFSKAFFDVATMLNNGADYTYPNVPAWINSDGITKDTALADTPCHDAAEYRAKWNAYYESLAALLAAITKKAKELADSAQSTADEQKGRIDDIVSDGKLDPSEKITIKREFLAFYHELYDDKGLEDKGKNEDGDFYTDEINNSFNSVVNSLGAVGTMLNNAVDWPVPNPSLIDKKLPIWLQNPPLPISGTDKNEYITDTSSIDADTFRSKWSAMYAAKSAYISLLSEYAKSLADNAQTTANGKANVFVSDSVPSQPYKRGDLWIQTANGNNVMICTVTRTGTDAGVLSDWADLSDTYDFKGIRTLLATLAEKIYDISGGYIESRGKINVYLYKDGAEMKDGNIRFDGNGVARCSQNAWTKIDNAGYTDAFTCVYGVLGSCLLTIYSSKPSSESKYDLVIRKTNWHDSFKNEDVKGNIEILMYNGSSWEMLRESTKAIIENLGDEIRTVVFGSDNKGATDASGLVTRTMFSELFSQKVKDDKVVTESTISTWLGENDYLTGASIKSWATDEAGFVKSATLDTYVKKVSIGDDKYSLESGIVLSADEINFIGKTIINGKFWVDKDGIVYMDDANVSGTINATKGKIGRFNIGYDGLYAGSWDSSKAETISDAWFDTDNKENICYLNSSSLWLEQQVGYFSAGDMAYMMVGLGRGSDPTTKGDENNYCSSAMYVYRNMMSMDFGGAESYYPAAKIISKNAFGCDIALRVVGGLQVHGGVMEKGYSMEYTASGNVNVLDLSNGTTLLLYTSIAPKTEGHTKTYQSFFFPTLTKLRYQLGISDTATSFSVRVVIIARKDTQDYMICTQKGISGVTDAEAGILVDNNGNEWQSSHEIMGRGDVTIYSLTFTPTTGYYVQLISNAD